MSRTMSFGGVPCEEYGLLLLDDSAVWTPAPHKGGYIDVPGGSEPVNFSEFASGQAEYAVGGEGEGAVFLVCPKLKGLADTMANRCAIVRAAKRLLHGKTVELSDSYHPEYSVEAVCSVAVDEKYRYTTLELSWQRQPVRLLEPGALEVPVAWEQAGFDPGDNVLLGLQSHPDVDTSMCGWDYEEVAERPWMPKPELFAEGLCLYVAQFDDDERLPRKWIDFAVVDADGARAALAGGKVGYRRLYWENSGCDVGAEELEELARVSGAGKLVDASAWADYDARGEAAYDDWPPLVAGKLCLTGEACDYGGPSGADMSRPFVPSVYWQPRTEAYLAFAEEKGMSGAGTDDWEQLESGAILTGAFRDWYPHGEMAGQLGCSYGDAAFGYSGYLKWVEPGEDPFPGAEHGMCEVPQPWLMQSEPSWYASRPVTDYSWPLALVPSRPCYADCGEAGATVCFYWACDYEGTTMRVAGGRAEDGAIIYEYVKVYEFRYVLLQSGADGLAPIPYGFEPYRYNAFWSEAERDEAYGDSSEEARDRFEEVMRSMGCVPLCHSYVAESPPGSELSFSTRNYNEVVVTTGDERFDYTGLFAWDEEGPRMRQAGPGDKWEPGRFYSSRVLSPVTEPPGHDGRIACLYRTYFVSGTALDVHMRFKVIEYAYVGAEALNSGDYQVKGYVFWVKGASGSEAFTQADMDFLALQAGGGDVEMVDASPYVGGGWPAPAEEGCLA